MDPRSFLVLENIAAILSPKQRPLMQYLMQEPMPCVSMTPLFVLSASARRQREGAWGSLGRLWMERWLEHRSWAQWDFKRKAKGLFSVNHYLTINLTYINLTYMFTKIWRERVFFLIAKPDFRMFEVPMHDRFLLSSGCFTMFYIWRAGWKSKQYWR